MNETSAAATLRGANRRITARHACQLQAAYNHANAWHPATAMDLSRRGCRLRLGEELSRGLRVTVRLSQLAPIGSGSPLSAEVAGDVIWSRLEGLSYQTGIHFYDDPPSLLGLLVALDE